MSMSYSSLLHVLYALSGYTLEKTNYYHKEQSGRPLTLSLKMQC